MTHENEVSFLKRILYILSVLCLFLLILSEVYSAAAIALDQFSPPWERTIGWFVFFLPCALALGLIFLLNASHRIVGFCLTASSLLLYAVVMLIDANRAPTTRADWIFESVWLLFCGLGVLAAKSLMSRPIPS